MRIVKISHQRLYGQKITVAVWDGLLACRRRHHGNDFADDEFGGK